VGVQQTLVLVCLASVTALGTRSDGTFSYVCTGIPGRGDEPQIVTPRRPGVSSLRASALGRGQW
jgi:hypothetical protein